MGDRLKGQGKRRKLKESAGLHPVWRDGAVSGRLLYLPGNRIVLVAWNTFTKMPLGSWPMSSQDYMSLRQEWEEDPMAKFLKAAAAKVEKKESPVAAEDKDLAKDHPAIVEYMTLKMLDDKSTRRTSSLLVFCEDGLWKLCLSDRENERTLWASAETFDEALEALEAVLQSPNPQWRSGGKKPTKK